MNWTTLTDIGCGQSITKNGCAITVCNYQDRTNPDIPKAPNLLSNKGADKNTDFANKIKCSKLLDVLASSLARLDPLHRDWTLTSQCLTILQFRHHMLPNERSQ